MIEPLNGHTVKGTSGIEMTCMGMHEVVGKVNEIIDWINQVDGKVIKCESVQNIDTAQKLEEALKLLREFTNLDYTEQTQEFNEIIWKVDSFLQKIGRSIM